MLAHPVVLGVAVTLFVVEFVADKIPYVDSVWDAVHTFIRPPAAAFLSYSAFASSVPEQWKIGAALLAGSVALTSHGAKSTARAAANVSPEPVSNWTLSIAEDGWRCSSRGWRRRIRSSRRASSWSLVILALLLMWRLFRFVKQVVIGSVAGPARRRRRDAVATRRHRRPNLPQPRPDPPPHPEPQPTRRRAVPHGDLHRAPEPT